MKIKGFTISEVLIAIVVIGIIAAITVPVLWVYKEQAERAGKVKKTYATISGALTLVKAQGGDYVFDVTGDEDLEMLKTWFNTYMKPFIATTKICYNEKGCWNEGNTKSLNGTTARFNQTGKGLGTNIITAVLTDGTFICVDGHRGYNLRDYFGVNITNDYGIAVTYDINGSREPNTIGKDIFVTVFTENGIVPAYKNKTKAEVDKDCSKTGTGYSCILKYLKQENSR
ncbi:MAG: prepilin-type N-terminal cleavage/methylation domain-containing protein [Candidatus Gastranaerophilales bacterium]|nr:prepilin-type N-terminal cleavage/methylation domain-containing protein [Candidatus Gastranaerophilales bacterium]